MFVCWNILPPTHRLYYWLNFVFPVWEYNGIMNILVSNFWEMHAYFSLCAWWDLEYLWSTLHGRDCQRVFKHNHTVCFPTSKKHGKIPVAQHLQWHLVLSAVLILAILEVLGWIGLDWIRLGWGHLIMRVRETFIHFLFIWMSIVENLFKSLVHFLFCYYSLI